MNEKSKLISATELNKLIKDHNVTSQMANKEQIGMIFRLVNLKLIGRNDHTALNFDGFLQWFI
jgi:hypothetical protein